MGIACDAAGVSVCQAVQPFSFLGPYETSNVLYNELSEVETRRVLVHAMK